jgi:lipid II:glycine glycyltransferase (peptidoglycan interpeptide bridge formation enzyme)
MFEIIDPSKTVNYDEMVLSTSGASFFHTSAWARVLVESYGYKPHYFAIQDGDSFSALVPCMEINSFLTGKRGVSLPFTDYCKQLIRDERDLGKIFEEIVSHGVKAGWRSIEIRDSLCRSDSKSSSHFYGHTLDLARNYDTIAASFRSSTRRNTAKALKSGITIQIGTTPDAIERFYRLNCLTRRDHGLPPQPLLFFRKIQEHIISLQHGIVVLATYAGRTIAGAVYFHFNGKAVYKFGASDSRYRHLRANNLVMAEAIRQLSEHGCQSLCFGRTEPGNKGLLQFKSGWGAVERRIDYYKFDIQKETFIEEKSKLHGMHNKIFGSMPISLLRMCGRLLYRHVG